MKLQTSMETNSLCACRGDDSILHLPETHPYYAQVQGEMAILNVEWCDFVVFSNGSVVVDRILADYDYWAKMSKTLDEFYTYIILSLKYWVGEFLRKSMQLCSNHNLAPVI